MLKYCINPSLKLVAGINLYICIQYCVSKLPVLQADLCDSLFKGFQHLQSGTTDGMLFT